METLSTCQAKRFLNPIFGNPSTTCRKTFKTSGSKKYWRKETSTFKTWQIPSGLTTRNMEAKGASSMRKRNLQRKSTAKGKDNSCPVRELQSRILHKFSNLKSQKSLRKWANFSKKLKLILRRAHASSSHNTNSQITC